MWGREGHDQCIAEIHTAPRMSRWRWSRPMLRPWKLSPASHSRHRAQTPSWGPLDRSGLSRLHIIETSELGKGKGEKEIVSFMKIMKKGLILTGSLLNARALVMVVRCGLRMPGTPDVYTASRQQSRSRQTGHLTQPETTGRTPGPWTVASCGRWWRRCRGGSQ